MNLRRGFKMDTAQTSSLQTTPATVFVNKVLLGHSDDHICLFLVSGCFHDTTAEPRGCNRDRRTPKQDIFLSNSIETFCWPLVQMESAWCCFSGIEGTLGSLPFYFKRSPFSEKNGAKIFFGGGHSRA